MQKCSVPIWVVRLVAPYGQSNFWRFSIYIIKDGGESVDMYAKYVFYVQKMYSNSDMPKHVTATTIAIKIENRIVWVLYIQFSGLERLTNTLIIIHSVSHVYSHAKSSHCSYTHVPACVCGSMCSHTLEQERHFTFAKSFIWKFFRLCFRHVSSSCQCQRSRISCSLRPRPTAQMREMVIWMCCFYTSRPYFIYVQPFRWLDHSTIHAIPYRVPPNTYDEE